MQPGHNGLYPSHLDAEPMISQAELSQLLDEDASALLSCTTDYGQVFDPASDNHSIISISSSPYSVQAFDPTSDNNSIASISSSPSSTGGTIGVGARDKVPKYPSPAPDYQSPYPLNHQRNRRSKASRSSRYRPTHTRSNTNSSLVQPAQPPHGYGRRRSLSHGDIDRFAATSNPTFVRLQTPQSRSWTPDDLGTPGSDMSWDKTSDQPLKKRKGQPRKSDISYIVHGSPHTGGMLPTPIGTPAALSAMDHVEWDNVQDLFSSDQPAVSNTGNKPLPAYDPSAHTMLHKMTTVRDVERSKQIIQIGAMAARKRSTIDPTLLNINDVSHLERALAKMEEVEIHLMHEGDKDHEVLGFCALIKENLRIKIDNKAKAKMRKEEENAPSKVMAAGDAAWYSDFLGETDLMGMLDRDCGAGDVEFVEL